ncbi:MAG: hypothetical protein WCH39_18710 [Schlesneria sp.]
MTASIQFRFSDFLEEIRSVQKITAREFMDPSAEGIFQQILANLQMIQEAGGSITSAWEVQEQTPLKTKLSTSWDRGGKASFPIFASLSWKWEINPNTTSKSRRQSDSFMVTGKASLVIKFLRQDDSTPLAEWKIDLGAVDSPGCYFHTHLAKSICVPRLPSLFVTPMDALEFVLGELFQEDWEKHASSESYDVQFWRSEKRKLLGRVLDWKKKQIQNGTGSPWVQLKRAKPSDIDRLFLPVPK